MKKTSEQVIRDIIDEAMNEVDLYDQLSWDYYQYFIALETSINTAISWLNDVLEAKDNSPGKTVEWIIKDKLVEISDVIIEFENLSEQNNSNDTIERVIRNKISKLWLEKALKRVQEN